MRQSPAPDGVFGHVTEAGAPEVSPPGADRPAWAATTFATDVPALDDVLDGSVDVAGTFRDKPRKSTKAKKSRKPSARRAPTEPPTDPWGKSPTEPPSEPPSESPTEHPTEPSSEPPTRSRRRAGSRRGQPTATSRPGVRQVVGAGGRAVRLARRRTPGVFARRRTLAAAAGLALVAGVGAGAMLDAVQGGGADPTAATTLAAVSPEVCASAQQSWARAAAAQSRMDLESPQTLRSGFVGAKDALSRQTPPEVVAAEWATVTDYVTAVADAVTETEDDGLEATVLTTIADLDTEAMTTASERITTYLSAGCTV